MGDIVVKVRFNASSQKFEKYGQNMYLVYLPFPQDEGTKDILKELLSRHMGTPTNRIYFKMINPVTKDWIFQAG